MLKLLYKTFYYNTFNYVVDAPKERVIERLDHLFTARAGLFKSPNLTGRFVDYPATFFLTQKWWLGNIRNFEQDPALLKGVISEVSDRQTQIEIAVRPNSVFLIMALFFLPYGIYFLYKGATADDLNATLVGIWTLAFGLPLVFFFAWKTSKGLRRTFERYMAVKPVAKTSLPLARVG